MWESKRLQHHALMGIAVPLLTGASALAQQQKANPGVGGRVSQKLPQAEAAAEDVRVDP